jgi:HK97 gp10 family phage protein
MMEVKLSYKGIDQLMRHLKRAATLEDVKAVVKTNTAEMTEKMQNKAPVDTGYLRRSITMNISEGGLVGMVTPRAEYAPYLEYGTRFMAAQPFVKPAFTYQKVKFMSEMKALVK